MAVSYWFQKTDVFLGMEEGLAETSPCFVHSTFVCVHVLSGWIWLEVFIGGTKALSSMRSMKGWSEWTSKKARREKFWASPPKRSWEWREWLAKHPFFKALKKQAFVEVPSKKLPSSSLLFASSTCKPFSKKTWHPSPKRNTFFTRFWCSDGCFRGPSPEELLQIRDGARQVLHLWEVYQLMEKSIAHPLQAPPSIRS